MDPLQQLRAALDHAGYAAEAVAARLGLDTNLVVRSDQVPVHLRRLAHGDALDALIRLLLLHSPLSVDDAERVLAPADVTALEEVGLLRREGEVVHPLLRLTPHEALFIAYDAHHPGALRPDSVLGPTSSARTLASMTVRDPVDRALDMGTGCGVQALLAARHARHVVAVDVSPRALWLTELNCRLNGISNVEGREGDLFDAVRGDTFDLVVTNPPFVISPAQDYLFRDSSLQRDGLSRAAVTGAAAVLNEGGFAHVMCNWVASPDEPWSTPLRRWVDGCGCDALLLHYDTLDPLRYAAAWNDDLTADSGRFAATLDSWLEYYREQRIDAIGMGAVVLRRRTAERHWVRTAELARGPSGSSGDQVRRLFAAQDDGGIEGDGALLEQTFAAVDRHRLHQVLTFRDGTYAAEDAVLVLEDGLGLRNRVPPEALHVLLRLDGSRSLSELVDETAEETELDAGSLVSAVTRCVRELYGLGFLERGRAVDG